MEKKVARTAPRTAGAGAAVATPVARRPAAGAQPSPRPANANAAPEDEELMEEESGGIKNWLLNDASPYMISALIHAGIMLILAVTLGTVAAVQSIGEALKFEDVVLEKEEETPKEEEIKIETMELEEDVDIDPSEIDLTETQPQAREAQDAKYFDDSKEFEDSGGGGRKDGDATAPQLGGSGEEFKGLKAGPSAKGGGGLGGGKGFGEFAGSGGDGNGFGGRGKGSREAMVGRYGGTKATERSVAAALNWIARHQNRDGSWSIENFHQNCQYGKCTGPGSSKSDSGATAMGLLPFLGAGQTHTSAGPYQRNIKAGIEWLLTHQNVATGDLSAGTPHVMYSHGLAAIALCEAYAMTKDNRVGYAAQAAIKFIETAQNKNDGGWRYRPGDAGDTSVVGWCAMALKSGQMAKLQVNPAVLEAVERKWLPSVGKGDYAGIFRYQPERDHFLPSSTAIGCLIREYMGAAKGDPGLAEGIDLLMKNMPDDKNGRNTYYWYYATQTIHHTLGENWDKWNRKMRRILVDTQVKGKGCDAGSWDPKLPTQDTWGAAGGRVMMTSLSCLTLEVYYRHLPLYDLGNEGPVKGKDAGKGKADGGKADDKKAAPKKEGGKMEEKGGDKKEPAVLG